MIKRVRVIVNTLISPCITGKLPSITTEPLPPWKPPRYRPLPQIPADCVTAVYYIRCERIFKRLADGDAVNINFFYDIALVGYHKYYIRAEKDFLIGYFGRNRAVCARNRSNIKFAYESYLYSLIFLMPFM